MISDKYFDFIGFILLKKLGNVRLFLKNINEDLIRQSSLHLCFISGGLIDTIRN